MRLRFLSQHSGGFVPLYSIVELQELARTSPHRGVIEHPTFSAESTNASCGDHVSLSGEVVGTRIVRMRFVGTGCVISQAAAAVLAEHCEGRELAEVSAYTAETVCELLGIELGPVRLKCALLSLEALRDALRSR